MPECIATPCPWSRGALALIPGPSDTRRCVAMSGWLATTPPRTFCLRFEGEILIVDIFTEMIDETGRHPEATTIQLERE